MTIQKDVLGGHDIIFRVEHTAYLFNYFLQFKQAIFM
jgi:hypothetical protein